MSKTVTGIATMKDIEWTLSETVSQWFGPAHDVAGEPLQIERTAKARMGQFELTVFEFDRTMNGEPPHVWPHVEARDVLIVGMNTDSGDFELSSLEAGKIAAVKIARALTKAGFRPADGWWNDPRYSRNAGL
jgi:hypothetical protein